jgi:hypothetical protein
MCVLKPNQSKYMKKHVLLSAIAGLLFVALATPTFAQDDKSKDKEVTLKGEAKCGKCALKETDSCQNVIETKEDGKTVKYYLAKNDVSKEFHSNVCKETKKVTAKGTVKEVDGKKEFTAKKIELAKE